MVRSLVPNQGYQRSARILEPALELTSMSVNVFLSTDRGRQR